MIHLKDCQTGEKPFLEHFLQSFVFFREIIELPKNVIKSTL